MRLSPDQLRDLADDAFEVMNWARRLGMRREQQIDEVVKAFEVRLGYREPAIQFAAPKRRRAMTAIEWAHETANPEKG